MLIWHHFLFLGAGRGDAPPLVVRLAAAGGAGGSWALRGDHALDRRPPLSLTDQYQFAVGILLSEQAIGGDKGLVVLLGEIIGDHRDSDTVAPLPRSAGTAPIGGVYTIVNMQPPPGP